MKFKNYVTLVLILGGLCLSSAFAQHYTESGKFLKSNSNWVFGDSAGINFNSTPPAGMVTANFGAEGSAAASHPVTGELLFYSNGAKSWKANGQVMAHGDSLLGNNEGGLTATQGVCIVPFINDTNRYYLFSLSDYSNPNSLYYSVVDMSLDNGQGDIDTARKNILLDGTSLSEAMVAIPGECNDIWLMLHSYREPEFIAYHITSKGIDTIPVISRVGKAVTGGVLATYSRMAVSPDRRKIAINGKNLSNTLAHITDFDPATGVVSNLVDVKNVTASETAHGICFSPDNTRLYVATVGVIFFATNPYRLYQFNISSHDSATIAGSRYSVYETNKSEYGTGADLRLYNDTIYICVKGTGAVPTDHINSINNPDISGIGCNYHEDVISLAPATRCGLTFGNDVVYPMAVDTIYHPHAADISICTGSSITIKAPPAFQEYLWSNGSTDTTFVVTTADTYWVSYRDSCYNLYIDTYIVDELVFMLPVIDIDSNTLHTTVPYKTYQWFLNGAVIPGATDSTYTATENGNYQVLVSNESGCTDISTAYPVTGITGIGSVTDPGDFIALYPNPAGERIWIKAPFPVNVTISTLSGRVTQQSQNVTSLKTNYLAPGMYFVTISDQAGRVLKVEKLIKTGN